MCRCMPRRRAGRASGAQPLGPGQVVVLGNCVSVRLLGTNPGRPWHPGGELAGGCWQNRGYLTSDIVRVDAVRRHASGQETVGGQTADRGVCSGSECACWHPCAPNAELALPDAAIGVAHAHQGAEATSTHSWLSSCPASLRMMSNVHYPPFGTQRPVARLHLGRLHLITKDRGTDTPAGVMHA
jgi:hypothetical protein